MSKGWHGNKEKHALASKGIKTKCDIKNPMNVRSNKKLVFGHAITHTKNIKRMWV